MTNSADTVADPGVDPVDPVTVLRLLREGLAAAEATITRFQALRDAQLGAAQRVAEEIAARDAGAGAVRGEAVDLATRSVAAELAGVLHMSDRVVQARMARAADLETRFPEVTRASGRRGSTPPTSGSSRTPAPASMTRCGPSSNKSRWRPVRGRHRIGRSGSSNGSRNGWRRGA